MSKYGSSLFCYFFSILMLIISYGVANEERKVRIVYMGSLPERAYSPSSHHLSLLQEVVAGSSVANYMIRSFKRSFNGFVANLTDHEAKILAGKEEVVSVFPSRTFQLQTTRSWDFMGFNVTATTSPTVKSDAIIGVIDSGIWPESASFSDEGFGPAPKKWNGSCEGGTNFTCNNKIIGARHYITSNSARDDLGHGTHTASTAAGNVVKNASFYGVASGNARGGLPSARIAVYKVCSVEGCTGADILAAFDDAIADGVDILTVSIGGSSAADFAQDPIAIGAFHALEKGILTSQSAGNFGPTGGSVCSVAPWILSVAASSTDRRIIDKAILGNGKTLVGNVINSFASNGTKFPLVYGSNASRLCSNTSAGLCQSGCLDSDLVKGKIVLCDEEDGAAEAYKAGAVGSIFPTASADNSVNHPFPAVALSPRQYSVVKSYMTSTKNPSATITKSQAVKDSTAPVVASFSSRGPNVIVQDIMKPDVSAPGVNILAAYPPVLSPSYSSEDSRRVKHNFLTGTSMACPHVAGVAAYVKTLHPDWSAAAIKSAIMTTARPMNVTANVDIEFAYGSGHINPVRAIHPGLVYDIAKEDYANMLCGMGYDSSDLRQILGNYTCPGRAKTVSPKDLNYPSMTVQVSDTSFKAVFNRTVTNVGTANSTYTVKVSKDPKFDITVVPKVLSFKSLKEKLSFSVTVLGEALEIGTVSSLSLVWSDGAHDVRSPIVVYNLEV